MESNLENVSNEIVNVSAPTPSPTPEKPKKSKGLLATTIIFAILALAGIAGSVYFYLDSNNKTAEKAELQTKLNLLEAETGAELVETIENGIANTAIKVPESDQSKTKSLIKQIYESLSSNIGDGRFYTVFGDGSTIRIPSTDVYTSSDESYGIISASLFYSPDTEKVVMSNAHTLVEAILEANGFTKDEKTMSNSLYYNSETGVYCAISENSLPFTLNCSKDTWISDVRKELVLDLAKKTGEFYVYADPTWIKDSIMTPYQKLTAYGINHAMLFYRTSEDVEWKFFTGTQSVLDCEKYNTEELKNAFAGETCFDTTSQSSSVVQP